MADGDVEKLVERLRVLLAKAPPTPWIIGEATIVRSYDERRDRTHWFGSLSSNEANELAVEAVNALPTLLATIEALARDKERLEEALAALVTKLDECEPYITNAFLLCAVRGATYAGPSYENELKAARAALTSGSSPGVDRGGVGE
jgi:hypothetical protein